MKALKRLVVVGVLVLAFVVVATPSLLAQRAAIAGKLPALVRGEEATGTQSGAQISAAEFARLENGIPFRELRALVGEPESRSRTEIEGIELECWYYGIVGSSGAYQGCFADGELRGKGRFDAGTAIPQ